MYQKIYIIFILVFVIDGILFTAHAQQPEGWDELMQLLADEAVATNDDADALEAQVADLDDLREHQMNLNTASKTELLRLPFLDDTQIDAFLDYRTRHAALHTFDELLLIPGIGQRELRWLRLVATISEPDASPQKKRLRQELLARIDVPLYERAGWPWARGIANRWRYIARYGRWEAGVRGERDAGEPMFTHDVPLWDAMGLYASVNNVGVLRQAIVGDFKVNFGEGIVINQGFGFGKMTPHFWRTGQTLRPHRSADEFSFMRGAAAELAFRHGWTLTTFASARHLDATPNSDNTVATIITSGYHRTDSELARRHNLWSHTAGAHAAWNNAMLAFGASALYQHYDHKLARGKALYRQIYPEGQHFGNMSIDYSLRRSWLALRGETARSFSEHGGGWATINRAAVRLNANTQFSAIQRFYSYRYYSAHARAYGENSNVQNESGICVMAEAQRVGPFALTAYFDLFYSPWPRYTMTHSSTGWETMGNVAYTHRRHTLTLRYRTKSKERSDTPIQTYHLRATYVVALNRSWSLQTTAFLNRQHTSDGNSTGYAFCPRVSFGDSQQTLGAALALTLFHTTDYDSRIAIYEPTLTQTFGLQQLYGRGQRLAATLRLRLGRHVSLQAKLGTTHYSDRTIISDGPTRIDSPWKTDILFQLKIR